MNPLLLAVVSTFAPLSVLAAEASTPFSWDGWKQPELELVGITAGKTEGPTVLPDGTLLFTDLVGGNIHQIDKDGAQSIFLELKHPANGLMADAEGNLFACEFEDGKGALSVYEPGFRERRVLADSFDGRPFNSVNDCVIDSHGGIYFTDMKGGDGFPQETKAVYYFASNGVVTRIIDDLLSPNGIILSPDEDRLYVSSTWEQRVVEYSVESPGVVSHGRDFYIFDRAHEKYPGGDGMAVDVHGNLYLTQYFGKRIHIVSPRGDLLGQIHLEYETTNCSFGGPGNRTLYVTAGSNVYAAEMPVPGHSFPGRPD